MRRSAVKILLCSQVLLGILGCQYDPNSNKYVTSKPTESSIVGEYHLTSQEVNPSLTVRGTPTIILSADHTCEVRDFPLWVEDSVAAYKLSGNSGGKGTWSMDVVGGMDNGTGKVADIYGIRFSGVPAKGSANLTLLGDQRGLVFVYGDPDSGTAMQYNKVK